MCIVKRQFFIVFILSAAVVSNCFADYIADIPVERIEGTLTSPPYEWDYGYDISFSNLEMNITLKLCHRDIDPASDLAQLWEAGIENTWNHKFDIVDRNFHYHINFDAIFYSNDSNDYHSIHWDTGLSGQAAAHEVGHLIGLYDEYIDGKVDPLNEIIDSNSIMGDLTGDALARHYQGFLEWVTPYADGRKLFLVEYNANWVNPTEVPEPATILLLTLGVILQRRTSVKH